MSSEYQFVITMNVMSATADVDNSVLSAIGKVDSILGNLSVEFSRTHEPYWKIPNCHQVMWELEAEDAYETFEALLSVMGGTWLTEKSSPSKWAVWKKENEILVADNVTWASVDVFPRNHIIET